MRDFADCVVINAFGGSPPKPVYDAAYAATKQFSEGHRDYLSLRDFEICALVVGAYHRFNSASVVRALRPWENRVEIKLTRESSPAIYIKPATPFDDIDFKKLMRTLRRVSASEVDIRQIGGKRVVRAWWD